MERPGPPHKGHGSWRSVLDALASILMIAAAVTLIAAGVRLRSNGARSAGRAEVPLPDQPISLDGAKVKGNATAPVALIMFSDFQCPFCAGFASETLPELEREYVATGHVVIAFRHFPLDNHPLALKAAQGAECAEQQGRFWDMHDRMFHAPQHL